MVIDLNGLKQTNDGFGHEMGDRLLQKTSELLKSVCRKDDIVGRMGGDEFLILLPKTDEMQAADDAMYQDKLKYKRVETS